MDQKTRLSLLDELKCDNAEPAWVNFCEIYEELICRWLCKEGLQNADIDDIKQEVMATLVTELRHFRHNGRSGAFRSWLRKIVSNRLHRTWERRSREKRVVCNVDLSLIAKQLADDASLMSAAWDAEHDSFVLDKLVSLISSRFPDDHMVAFRRIAFDGDAAKTVADDLGMSLGSVRVAQHRVLKALRQIAADLVD